MDRNQVTGFALLALLLVGYLFYNQHEQKVFLAQKKADSTAFALAHPRSKVDSSLAAGSSKAADTTIADSATAALWRAAARIPRPGTERNAGKQKTATAILH